MFRAWSLEPFLVVGFVVVALVASLALGFVAVVLCAVCCVFILRLFCPSAVQLHVWHNSAFRLV